MNVNRFLTSLILAGVACAGTACSNQPGKDAPPTETVKGIKVMTVAKSVQPAYSEAVGSVRAEQTAQVASQVTGTITRVYVREGDRVSRGQVLATIDDAQTRAGVDRAHAALGGAKQEIAAADADYTLAEATFKRYQELFAKRSVSPHEMDEVTARLEAAKAHREAIRSGAAQAQAELRQASSLQGYTQIRAPFAGMVTAKLADGGSLAQPGVPVFTVEDTSKFRLEVLVDEQRIGSIRPGAKVAVLIDALGADAMEATVAQVVPAADASSRSFVVKLSLPVNASLRSGLYGRARFALGEREVLSVPRSALVSRGGLKALYVVGAEQIASLRYVTLGRAEGEEYEVLSGLESGERIVAAPGTRELNGRKVEVQ